MTESVLILDPLTARNFLAQQEAAGHDRYNEVWEGRVVVPSVANNEHSRMVGWLYSAFSAVIDWDHGDQVLPGANVSDRVEDWTFNYRVPDVLVVLAGSSAVDHGTFWHGGPDLAVEIISPGEDPHAKFGFYAAVGTREVLIVDRNPWAVELYQLQGGAFVAGGRSDLANPAVLTSAVLPVTFRLVPGRDRPRIEVAHPATNRTWLA